MVLAIAACTEATPAQMVGTLERDRIELKVESDKPMMTIAVADGAAVAAGQLILQQDPARAPRGRPTPGAARPGGHATGGT